MEHGMAQCWVSDSPTRLYVSLLDFITQYGDKLAPRGKEIREVRPVMVQFTDPEQRYPFIKGRRVNPFFNLAEALWMLSGRADVRWLKQFNAGIGFSSDDGVYFNAPYGERLRSWNKNAARDFIFNPIDQMADAYNKLLHDPETRQAVMVIYNPLFDNSAYSVTHGGKDVPCNDMVSFKYRGNKLHMTVFNRSNDLHWGLFGANLSQFTHVLETMTAWLRGSDLEEFQDVQMGDYTQVSDSLHVYTQDYGYQLTETVLQAWKDKKDWNGCANTNLTVPDEPRMTLSFSQFNEFLRWFWNDINPLMSDEDKMTAAAVKNNVFLEAVLAGFVVGKCDAYWRDALLLMYAYRLVKSSYLSAALDIISHIQPSAWKLACTSYLRPIINKPDNLKKAPFGVDVLPVEQRRAALMEDYDHLAESIVNGYSDTRAKNIAKDFLN